MTRDEFIRLLAPSVIAVRLEGSPLFPSVRLAQNVLETGGKLPSWNNLGGIKAGSGRPNAYWSGAVVNRRTWEVENGVRRDISADFRAYDSVYDFYKDQDLLMDLPRYARVRAAQSPEEQAYALQSSGYATDPQYGNKLILLIAQHNLKQYDREAEQLLERLTSELETLRREVDALQGRLSMSEIPDWARAAVDAAVKKGVVASPEGRSFDFYSVITVMHRMGLL